jgi:hypothetical protein
MGFGVRAAAGGVPLLTGELTVNDSFEWMRIALAMGLMVTGFVLLPMFFLWKDKREDERARVAAEAADDWADDRELDAGAGR